MLTDQELLLVCKSNNKDKLILRKKHTPKTLLKKKGNNPSSLSGTRPPSDIIGQDLTSYFPNHKRERLESFYGKNRQSIQSPEKWLKGALIGAGSFGNVYLGLNSITGELMAVKQVELVSSSDKSSRKAAMVILI
jgi:hypothetical protein